MQLADTETDTGIDETSHQDDKDMNNSNRPSTKEESRRQWLNTVASSVAAGVAGSSFSLLSAPQTSQAAVDVITTRAVCDPAVSVWRKNGRIVYLLGTAHISSSSAALAGQLVRDTSPSGVFVELDPKRVSGSGVLAQKVGDDNADGQVDGVGPSAPDSKSRIIVPQIHIIDGPAMGMPPPSRPLLLALGDDRGGGDRDPTYASPTAVLPPPPPPAKRSRPNPLVQAASVVVGNSIKGMYKNLDSAGFESGEEFVAAIKEGRKLGSDIVLGDRDVEVTLRRVTEGLVKTDLKALLNPDSELEKSLHELVPKSMQAQLEAGNAGGVGGISPMGDFSNAEFREEFSSFVEIMKSKDNVQKIMGQLQRVAPFLYDALVGERDAYMAAGLNGLNELETIVAVVGIAHVYGIEGNLQANGWTLANLRCSKYR